MGKNIFMPELAIIEDIKNETPNIRTLTISKQEKKAFHALPGQFIEITLFGYGEFPVSISAMLDKRGTFQATVQEKGGVTAEVKNLKGGAIIGIRGPFGNGYPQEMLKGKNIYFITGGIGLSAVWMLLDTIVKKRNQYGNVKLLHGARTPSDMIYRDSFIYDAIEAKKKGVDAFLTVDRAENHWKGQAGLVTELFQSADICPDNSIVVMCGPAMMMKFALQGLISKGFLENQLILSMERRMQCGMGACGHCMMGHNRVCLNGPVFNYAEIKDALDKIF